MNKEYTTILNKDSMRYSFRKFKCWYLNLIHHLHFVVNGTSGEGMSLSAKERMDIAEAWVDAAQDTKQHIMVQVGGAALPDVIEMVRPV